MEKSGAIAEIVNKIREANVVGGFIKKDHLTGRWHRITDAEARDKVGHAIRKAVQRLEEAKPKHAARIRKDHEEMKIGKNFGRSSIRRPPSPTTATKETSSLHGAAETAVPRHPSHQDRRTTSGHTSEAVRTNAPLSHPRDFKIETPSILDVVQPRSAILLPALSNTTSGHLNQGHFSSSSALRGLPTFLNPTFPASNFSLFPPSNSTNHPRHVDSSVLNHLVSPMSLLRNHASLHLASHPFNQPYGITSRVAQASQADKLWLTAAALRQQHTQQQQEIQSLKDLAYACRLAQVATGNIGSSYQIAQSLSGENSSNKVDHPHEVPAKKESGKPDGKKHRQNKPV
jgi:hypothetical protein